MKYVIVHALTLLFCCVEIIPFEVKVLLQKSLAKELQEHAIHLQSRSGFVIGSHPTLSVGKVYADKNLTISVKDGNFIINGEEKKSSCYITPLLSFKHQEALFQRIHDWLHNHKQELEKHNNILEQFFNDFMEKKGVLLDQSYDVLKDYVQDVFMAFLIDVTQKTEKNHEVLSLQTLEGYVHLFLKQGVKESFLHRLSLENVSKKGRKLLHQDKQHRYNFFYKQLFMLLEPSLKEFMLMLPRNFLSQMLHQDVECLGFQGNNYVGSFALLREDAMVYLINCLDIDDYLLSVIRHEGWPGWPLEMNKVLAITCRTYLVWQVLQAKKSKRPYHIESGIRHQTYKGHHKVIRLKAAIEETRDLCIAYENKPILAMYDSCCGGVIPALIDHQDYQKHPYLLRNHACTFCKDFKIATWKASFSHDEMVAVFKKDIPNLETIDDMIVTKKDQAGLITDVSIQTQPIMFHATGKKMYSLFPEIKSFCFDIESYPKKVVSKSKSKHHKKVKVDKRSPMLPQEKKFVISGKGYGHHIGLCQWGAMKLVRDNHWNYQAVLQFYYPGTDLIKLVYQR